MQDLDAFVRSLEGKTASELVELGKSFGNGGDETDDELMREMKCFERAASLGDAEGKYRLGWFYIGTVDFVPEQPELAARLYAEAYEGGYKYAPGRLGYAVLTGYGVEKNDYRAESLLREGADNGDLWALFNLIGLYFRSDSPLRDDDKYFAAVSELAHAAVEPDDDEYLLYVSAAQRYLSDCYFKGIGVPPDFDEGIKWLKLAVEHGDSIAGKRLGKRYMDGDGVPRDGAKAKEVFEAIVPFDEYDETAASAKYYIGLLYETGNGVGQDSARAEAYYKEAVGTGLECPEAWAKYGTYLVNRSASPQEGEAGRALIRRAADAGEESAIKAVGRFGGALPCLQERKQLQPSFKDLNDPDLIEDDIDVDQIIDFAYAYWCGVGCSVDHDRAYGLLLALVNRDPGGVFGGDDKRLASMMRDHVLEGGRDESGRDAELWDAVARGDMQVLNDHVHESIGEDAAQNVAHLGQAMFWADIAANHINNVWAGKIAILAFLFQAQVMDFAGVGDGVIRAARTALKWTGRYLDDGILNFMSPNARDDLASLRQQLQEWDVDAWFYRARGFFRMLQSLEEDDPMRPIARQRAIAAASDGYAHGSVAAGALKAKIMAQSVESDAEFLTVASYAEGLLASGAEAALAEMDRRDQDSSPLHLGDGVLYMAGSRYVTGPAKNLNKAHDLFEMGAGRGYELCEAELAHFKKKMFGGWSYA